MTFKFLSIFHDFPGKFFFPGFSMIFHDRGNPANTFKMCWLSRRNYNSS